jgi:peptidoglycan/LPS O-acetylase OafA/YrhL
MLTKLWLSLAATLLLGVVVTLLIWVTLRCAKGPLPSGYVWLARRAAHSSYTLYLVQMPMLIFLKASLHLPRAVPNLRGFMVGIVVLVAILLYAQLLYELFEKNTHRVREWLAPCVLGRRPT